MNLSTLQLLDSYLRGTRGLVLIFLAVLACVIAGLRKAQAPFLRYLLAPLLAALALPVGALGAWLIGIVLPEPLSEMASLGVYLALGFAIGRWWPAAVAGVQHHRGALVGDPTASFASGQLKPCPGHSLTLAGLAVPPADETKHFKMIGTTGTGKSTAIRELLSGALARGDRAVIADPDGGYLARFFDPERGDLILNPFEPRSRRWDLFGEIRQPYDVDQLARALIPDGCGEDRIWQQYAQVFLAALMRQASESGNGDIAEVYRLTTTAPVEELRLLLEGTPAQPFLAAGNERNFGSTRSVTTAAVASLAFIAKQKAAPLSIRTWVNEGRGVLFLPYRVDQIASLRCVISTWMRVAIFETMNRPEGDGRLWFVVDELDALGQIDGLKDALARLRKFGGRCVLGFQSIAQVSGTYGNAQAHTIVENCGNTLILRCSASEGGGTAQFASRLIGEREIIREQVSTSRRPQELLSSRTTSHQHVTESAVLASEIEQLPDLQGFLKVASQPQWRRAILSI